MPKSHAIFFIVHVYLLFRRKRIVSLSFGRDVRTHLAVAFFKVSGPPDFHIKLGATRLVPCPRTQQANFPAYSPQNTLNAERQAGKLWILFFRVFWYDSTSE